MAEFLPNGSLYVFLGATGVLFVMMLTCFGYYKGRTFCKNPGSKRPKKGTNSFKRNTRRNKFLMKRGERADKEEENAAIESKVDKMRAEIDAKYSNNAIWTSEESARNNP